MSMRPEPAEDLGPCCCCGGTKDVRTIMMLDRPAIVPGTGWACLVCGLPADGAVYVACDRCVENKAEPIHAVHGLVNDKRRVAIDGLPAGTFEHDLSKHPEYGPS
jgi:hypothetical protein